MKDNLRLEASELLRFTKTAVQHRHLKAIVSEGTVRKAATLLECSGNNIHQSVRAARKYAGQQGYAPAHDMTRTAPESHFVKGTSTLYGADGAIKGQWVKTDTRREELSETLQELAAGILEDLPGKSKSVKPPKHSNADLLSVTVLGDPHAGLYAWQEETGANFDLKHFERDTRTAVTALTDLSPPSEHGILLSVGDTFHAHDDTRKTARSGHSLDVDGRHAKIMRKTAALWRELTYGMLEKHRHVTIVTANGNHDSNSGVMLSMILEAFFHKEKRVDVVVSPNPFWYHQHGQTLLAVTHGDTVKLDKLGPVVAADVPQMWGSTVFRYGLTGHIHSKNVVDAPGFLSESFRNLTPNDMWNHAQGYRATKDASVITYHRNYGEVQRSTISLAQVRAQQGEQR